MELVDTFTYNGTAWLACEDLQQPGGDIVLVRSSDAHIERFNKAYAPFTTNWTDDADFYLGLTKAAVANATSDIMGAKLLNDHAKNGVSWDAVAAAVPPIRHNGPVAAGGWGSNCHGARTFVGSRSAAVDTTFDDHGGDCNWEGWPSWESYAVNMHNKAVGAPQQAYNSSISGDGNVGGVLPTAVFYLPMFDNGTSINRYWTYFAVAVADICPTPANGCREQAVLFRFQQLQCAGPNKQPPCTMVDWPMYWNSYWYSRFPGANATDTEQQTLQTGPTNATSSSEFYEALLGNRHWWDAELAKEGMMELSLPSSPKTATNGTWLHQQAVQSIVRSMITRENTWHPRYGVRPGYGDVSHDGLTEVFTATATAALEFGAMPYAKGVIDNQFTHYVRDDGMVWYRSQEYPGTARMLTILALYYSYSGTTAEGCQPMPDDAFLVGHFSRARALATLLVARRTASLKYSRSDSRHGIPGADDEGRDGVGAGVLNGDAAPMHWYASAAELYRACTEMGRVWTAVGKSTGRADISKHGAELLALAPQIQTDLQNSLQKTVRTSTAAAPAAGKARCWQLVAEANSTKPTSFRGYSEMMYSGALSSTQVDDLYTAAAGDSSCGATRFLTLGTPGLGGDATISSPSSYGFGFGLLQADMVERFLLHFFTMSAHSYTRGTFTSPESSNLANRDDPAVAYTAAGVVVTTVYLKWMLCFEEPETRTLWLAKATPRDWLEVGEDPLVVTALTTRYGRMSYSLAPVAAAAVGSDGSAAYSVRANITLPASFAAAPPAGGIKLRIRAPTEHAGKLSGVTVGGAAWATFDAAEETITIAAEKIDAKLIATGLPSIVATFH